MKLLAFLIPFFLMWNTCLLALEEGNNTEENNQEEQVDNEITEEQFNNECQKVKAESNDKTQELNLNNSILSRQYTNVRNPTITKKECLIFSNLETGSEVSKLCTYISDAKYGYIQNPNPKARMVCVISKETLISRIEGAKMETDVGNLVNDVKGLGQSNCEKIDGGKWVKETQKCDLSDKLECEGGKRVNGVAPSGSYWQKVSESPIKFECSAAICQKLKNPTKDCSPERRETMTDVFIQGLGFVSASSGNTCIALAIQSFPQTKAYSSAVKKCKKQKKEACKSVNGKPQCKSCKAYKEALEHVKAESVKMLAGYQDAVKCAQQTKTDYKGSAEECNVINAFNRDKCCFMPEHMNTPLCDDFGSEHAFSPNLGYTDKKRIGGGESIDYGGDELPFVHSPSKFDPKKDPILNSPLSPDSGSSIGGGGGAGGSPYTNSDSALGLSRKGAFQTYIQGGGGSRLGKSSSKNKSYPYALSSFERKKLKYKNKNNKKGKATIRSLASKRNRTIFEKISDVYTSLINKRKLFFKRDGAQK